MKYSVVVSVQPPVEPLTLAQAKAHLRVDSSAEDDLITALIKAAREAIEIETGRALVQQTQVMRMDCFPPWEIWIPNPKLIEVVSIQYVDTNGDTQTLATTEYLVDTSTEPGRITPAYGKFWPCTRWQMNAVQITSKVGYSPDESASPTDYRANIPQELIHAHKLLIDHLFENRGALINAQNVEMPMGVKSLIWHHKVALY